MTHSADPIIAIDSASYSYNRLGQRTGVTDQRGCVHEFDYDGLGRLTEDRVTTLPAGWPGQNGRVAERQEASPSVINVASGYDPEGRDDR